MITPNADQLVAEGIELDRHCAWPAIEASVQDRRPLTHPRVPVTARADVFYFCAPTRSSLMSGRLPYHVNQLILSSMLPGWDMPKEMTAMPKKLARAGCKVADPLALVLSAATDGGARWGFDT